MNVVCALASPSEDRGGVLVLPEGVSREVLLTTSRRLPNTIVVGAAREQNYMRAFLLRNGENHLAYLKTAADGRSDPYVEPQNLPVYVAEDIVIGVLVCIDYQVNDLRNSVLTYLGEASANRVPLICIPADMSGDFFQSESGGTFSGAYVALCNNRLTYENPSRCRSFIADKTGSFIAQQVDYEEIRADAL